MITTPFDRRILWVHWKGDVVAEQSIGELADSIRRDTPNVAGVLVKSNDGENWQGRFDGKPSLAINGPEDITRWVTELGQRGLEVHLWCVVRGLDIIRESEVIVRACSVSGVRSMLLDVEDGPDYFGGRTAADARNLITRIRAGLPAGFHLGLNYDARGSHPARIHFNEWLPHVNSLHPMVYHWLFSGGAGGPEPYLDETFAQLARYGLPVVPMLQTYLSPSPVPEEEVFKAGTYSFLKGAFGISLFRYGGTASAPQILAGVRRIDRMTLPGSVARRVFRVLVPGLRVRSAPSLSAPVVTALPGLSLLEVDPASRTEAEGYVWWRGSQGWSAQERIDRLQVLMLELTPGGPPYGLPTPAELPTPPDGEEPPPPDGPPVATKRFRVLADRLNVRSEPDLRPEFLTGVQLRQGEEVAVSADAWAEADGHLWWRHAGGWSAERTLDSQRRYMQDLTPDIPRVDPPPKDGGTTPPGPEPPEVPDKRFRVVASRLNIRTEPGLARRVLTGEVLVQGVEVVVRADAWAEKDGYLWWQHGRGWSAERSLDGLQVFMEDLTPGIPRVEPGGSTTPEPEPPPDQPVKRLQVVAASVNVRNSPDLSASVVGALVQGDEFEVDPDDPGVGAEADGWVWWRHSQGWSAERRADGTSELMLDVNELPHLGALFERHPARIETTEWVQYFGNTWFAYLYGIQHNYPNFSQGLHSGLDYGKNENNPVELPVFAGVHGIFRGRGSAYGPNRVDVQVGDYRIIYGHLGRPASLPVGQPVTPDAVLGVIENTRIHLHLEVRYKDRYIINPLWLMPSGLVSAFVDRFPPGTGTFVNTPSWGKWTTPLSQPIIRLGGPVIGPLTLPVPQTAPQFVQPLAGEGP